MVEPRGASSTEARTAYRIRLVPRLRLLKWQTTSRIFQARTVPDIVATVLAQATIPVAARWKLSRDYPVRDYCLQHQETDLAFVERLLAEEGIFYYFDHPSADDLAGASPSGFSEILALADSADAYPPIEGESSGSAPRSPCGQPRVCGRPGTTTSRPSR